MNPVLKKLILKDVLLNLPLMVMMVVAGLAALVVMRIGDAGYAIGGVLYITANIAGGIFMGMYCIVQERKDQSSLFALSLPVSVRELNTVKFAAALIVYTVPWLVLSAVLIVSHFFREDVPFGMIVFSLMLQGSFVALTTVYFSLISVTRSDALAGFAILFLNMGFSLFMVWVNQPRIRSPLRTEHLVWTTPAIVTLAIEAALVAGALIFGFLLLSRRREAF